MLLHHSKLMMRLIPSAFSSCTSLYIDGNCIYTFCTLKFVKFIAASKALGIVKGASEWITSTLQVPIKLS